MFNASTQQWLLDVMAGEAKAYHSNATHSSSRAGAGDVGTDVSYNNMYYMGMVNGILFGEIVNDTVRDNFPFHFPCCQHHAPVA